MRLEVEHPVVRVYIDGEAAPSLTVEQLGRQARGRPGLWVGSPSAGEFAAVRVVHRR